MDRQRPALLDIDAESRGVAKLVQQTDEWSFFPWTDPLTVLFPQTARSELAVVSASKVWLTLPGANEGRRPTNGHLYGDELRVLGQVQVDGDELLTVLLPGWGQAWVKKSDVTTEKTAAIPLAMAAVSATSTTNVRPRSNLSLHVTLDTSDQSVLALLRAVGHGVRMLDLCSQASNAMISERWLCTVLHACPLVEDLSFSCAIFDSLEMFARFYESDCGSRLKYLTLDVVDLEVQDSVAHFLDRLADTTHPLAQHLRALDLTVSAFTRPTPHVDVSVLHMLEQNERLRDLRLSVQVPLRDRSIPDKTIDSHHNKVIVDRVKLRNKLAFLSVITSSGGGWKKKDDGSTSANGGGKRLRRSAIHLLDNRAIELVFQFAAVSWTRHVEVVIKPEQPG